MVNIKTLKATDEEMSNDFCLFLALVRLHEYLFAHTGSQHKAIMGHYHFFKLTNHICVSL